MKEKKKLEKLLRIEGVAIPASSAFVGSAYLQHASEEGKEELAL